MTAGWALLPLNRRGAGTLLLKGPYIGGIKINNFRIIWVYPKELGAIFRFM